MVKNQRFKSRAEWIWNVEVRDLPLFSLVFTEFWSTGHSFNTIWHKEKTGWLEKATTVVDQQTQRIVDVEVALTMYYPAQRSTRPMWHLYTL